MKKIIIIALSMVVLPFAIHAQGIGIGVKAGANFANQSISDISTSSITNFHGGAYVNLMFSEKFGIAPEILWTATGSEWDDVKVNTNYVAIPVMLHYKLINPLFIEAGPQFSFLTSAEHDTFDDFEDQLKNNDFGLAFGAGIGLPLGLKAGLRYVLGFTNISEVSDTEVKNRVFQIYAGWTLLGAK